MARLLVWVLVLGSLAVVAAFVPLHGRTVAERYRAAASTMAFVEGGLKEIADAFGRAEPERRAGARAPQRAAHAAARSGPAAAKAPVVQERHSEADRSALDRIVAEHQGPPRSP
ncbi:MAG TPA: hypothetical protein VMK42_18340 [Anaeromyxobacteraceae bacterium]|nr:hypothetical protein [Anaeromyxobacteraceae bacterium]